MNNTENNINFSSFPSFQQFGDLRIFGVSSRLIYEGSPCDAFPCWNGGTCIELRKRKNLKNSKINYKQEEKIKKEGINYFCKCNYYFTGKHCEQKLIKIEKCQNQQFPCPNGTFCWLNLSNFTSECISSKEMIRNVNNSINNSTKTNLLTTEESFSFLTELFLLALILFSFALFLLICHGPASSVGEFCLFYLNENFKNDCLARAHAKKQFPWLRRPKKDFSKLILIDNVEEDKEEEFELKNI